MAKPVRDSQEMINFDGPRQTGALKSDILSMTLLVTNTLTTGKARHVVFIMIIGAAIRGAGTLKESRSRDDCTESPHTEHQAHYHKYSFESDRLLVRRSAAFELGLHF